MSGATLWFTGLPASGKSTIATEVARRLDERRVAAYVLDGDVLRRGLSRDLGYTLADRRENVRRIAHVARLVADAGLIALVPVISPYAEGRRESREIHEEWGLPFAEVYVNTPVAECERRDPKGLYGRARRGEISGLTGVDDPYEVPEGADLELLTQELSVTEAADRVLALAEAVTSRAATAVRGTARP